MRISILTLIFILAFSALSSGQIQKGTWTLDGDLFSSYPGYRDYNLNYYDFRLNTEGSYFLTKNINIGANIGVNYYKFKYLLLDDSIDTLHQSDLTTTLNFRYYINPKQRIKVYGQIDPGLGFGITYLNRKEEKGVDDSIYEKKRWQRRTLYLRPSVEAGLNYFITKNIAFETALNLRLFESENRWSFTNGEFDNKGSHFYSEDLWTLSIGMRFFFNVEDTEQITYSPETYLKKGNLTFGVNLGYSTFISPGYRQHAPYHSSPHISYFLTDNWAIGMTLHYAMNYNFGAIGVVPSMEYYFPISTKFQIVPSLESYLGTATQLLPTEDHYGDFGSLFNIGVKANYFIAENISIWGGPFFNRNKAFWGDPEYHINLKGGFRYFMVSKKNR